MIQKAVQYNNYKIQTYQEFRKNYKQIEDFGRNVANLEEDIQKQALLCAANIELYQGRQWLAKVFETEDFEVGIVHDALDCFNSASKIAEGKDFETEAIAEALAGKVHYKCLKNLPKARDRLYNAMRLSNMMTYTNVQEKSWYQLASKQYQEVRDQLAREGSKVQDEERQKILDEIKGEVKAIEAARKKGTKPLLEFLNEKYLKPADKEVPLGEEALKESKIKSTILKFTREFHPDKQVNKPRKY